MGVRLLHTADIHLGALRRLDVPFQWKLDRYKGILEFIFTTARKKNVDYVVIAGDIYDHKDPHPKVRDIFLEALLKYDERPIVIIPGNHDELESGYTNLHNLAILQRDKRLPHVFFTETKPRILHMPRCTFVLVPCTEDDTGYGRMVDRLIRKVEGDNPVVVVGHEMVAGVTDDSGWKARKGVRIKKNDRVTYWAMGDIHKRQPLSGLKNAWYPGSPAQHKFSELPNKGVLLVDLDHPTRPKLIKNNHPKVKKLVALETDDPKDLEQVETDSWVHLKTSNIEAMRSWRGDLVRSTPRKMPKAEVQKIETNDPLTGLGRWLQERVGFDEEKANRAVDIARGLV